jgi:phosphohistidine phosphatase
MKLFLLRHAAATDSYHDSTRELSPKGLAQVEALASRLDPAKFCNVAQVWHSPFVRAEQTAQKFAGLMKIGAPLLSNNALKPSDNPEQTARSVAMLSQMGADLLIVGHNPHLEDLSSLLILGELKDSVVVFHNCSLLCLELFDDPGIRNEFGKWVISGFLS